MQKREIVGKTFHLEDVFAMIAEEYEEEDRQLPPDVPIKVANVG